MAGPVHSPSDRTLLQRAFEHDHRLAGTIPGDDQARGLPGQLGGQVVPLGDQLVEAHPQTLPVPVDTQAQRQVAALVQVGPTDPIPKRRGLFRTVDGDRSHGDGDQTERQERERSGCGHSGHDWIRSRVGGRQTLRAGTYPSPHPPSCANATSAGASLGTFGQRRDAPPASFSSAREQVQRRTASR